MKDHGNSCGLLRRQFFALSGAMGTAALLAEAGAGAGTAAAAAVRTAHGEAASGPCPCPCPCPPGPGASPCPPARLASLCGRPGDSDPLWADVQYCVHGTPPPPPQPKPDCLKKAPNYVVLHGEPRTTHNYLLSPSCRITGIECPFLEDASVANYWFEAWDNARPGGSVPVEYSEIGLGINSQTARHFNQMHIHMAGVRDSTQRRLQELERTGRVATSPQQWNNVNYRVPVTGANQQDRTYRALVLPNLDQNLFSLLYDNVVSKAGLDMAKQTLIVVPKKTAAGFVGTFYVLNSDQSLHDGTDTCDHVLVYAAA